MPSNSRGLWLYSSMCRFLLNPVFSFAPLSASMLFLLSMSPKLLVLFQSKPASPVRLRMGVHRTHQGRRYSLVLSGEASHHLLASAPHLFLLHVVLYRVLKRELSTASIAYCPTFSALLTPPFAFYVLQVVGHFSLSLSSLAFIFLLFLPFLIIFTLMSF